jgi:glycosyltransferase involved in cell wall biosynthesis
MGRLFRGEGMIKIGLYLGVDPYAGGMFQYCQAVLEALRALPHEEYAVVVVHTSVLWSKKLDEYGMKSLHIRHGLGRKTFWKMWKALRLPASAGRRIGSYFDPVARALLSERCNLWVFPSQDSLAVQAPVPSLTAIHDLMHRYERRFPEVSERGVYWKRDWIYRNICKCADGILVDSRVGKMHVMESYGQSGERIHILPYIAPEHIRAHGISADPWLKYDLPKKYIFYPAQFWEHKNHKSLIEAVGRLVREIPDLKLILVGAQNNGYESTVEFIHKRDLSSVVMVLGYVAEEDMRELYLRARALVMPTYFGPTNIPPLEAFAVGCPVAVSGIYGIPEQVGDAALLFNPGSVEEIASCVKKLWVDDELCAELIRKGKQRSAAWGQKQFNERFWEIIVQTLKVRSAASSVRNEN